MTRCRIFRSWLNFHFPIFQRSQTLNPCAPWPNNCLSFCMTSMPPYRGGDALLRMEGILMHVTRTLQTFFCPQTHTGGLALSQLIHTSDWLCSWLERSIWWHEEKHSPSRELFTCSEGEPGTAKESTEMASHQSCYTKSPGKKEASRPLADCVGCSLEIWADNLLPACRQHPVMSGDRHGHRMDRWRGEGEQLMVLPLGIKQDPDGINQSSLNQLCLDHLP